MHHLAAFEQKRSLVELLIDRMIVTDGEVEIRCAVPTSRASEKVRFCHLRLDYQQDHRRIKRLVRPGLGFGGLESVKRTLAGYEAMAIIRKGQVHNVGGRDMQAQAAFVAGLFEVVA